MIFPDVSTEEWCRRYPALEVKSRPCHTCRRPRTANIPFIEKHWVGLRSKDCMCGRGKAIAVSTPRTDATDDALSQLFASFD